MEKGRGPRASVGLTLPGSVPGGGSRNSMGREGGGWWRINGGGGEGKKGF